VIKLDDPDGAVITENTYSYIVRAPVGDSAVRLFRLQHPRTQYIRHVRNIPEKSSFNERIGFVPICLFFLLTLRTSVVKKVCLMPPLNKDSEAPPHSSHLFPHQICAPPQLFSSPSPGLSKEAFLAGQVAGMAEL
jgi:hypothetical protein